MRARQRVAAHRSDWPGGAARPLGFCLGVALLLLAGIADAQYFGQNKVPGPPRDWRILESEHFALHFYEQEREAAEEALRVAERAYARLSRAFDHQIEQRVPVIVYASQSEFQETRAISSLLGEGTGGVTEFYKRRVIVPLTGSPAELDHVLSHELVHAFQIDILGNASRMPDVTSLSWMPPLWVVEGLAEYFSVPGLDAHTEMWLRDAILEGTLPTLEQLSYVGDIRVYRFGQAIIAYVAEQFGDEAIGPWLRSMALRRSLEQGTRESLGLTVEKLSEDWHEAMRRRYFPALNAHRRPAEEGRRLTDVRRARTFFHVIPALSPDGRELVYVAGDGLYSDLYRASAVDGKQRRRLIRGYREETYESLRFYTTSVAWSPDGQQIALIARTGGRDLLTIFDVGQRRAVAQYAFGFDEMRSPAWSPDGQRLVFVGLRQGRANLYRVDRDGGNLRALTDERWGVMQPAWSPDGQRIAFATDRGYVAAAPDHRRPIWRIALLDCTSGEIELLPGQVGKNIDPHWFPDGVHLLYVSDRSGIANLVVRDLATQRDAPLTDLLTGVAGITATSSAVSLAANGERLVCGFYEQGGWDLLAIDDPLDRIAAGTAATVAAEPAGGLLAVELPAAPESLAAEPPPPARPDSAACRPALIALVTDSTHGIAGAVPRPAPFTLQQLFTEVGELPESLTVAERPYRAHFTIDYASAAGLYASGFGFLAQTGVVLSDMLGDQSLILAADVSGSLEEGNYLVSYRNQSRRPGLTAALYQYWTGYGYGTYPGFIEEYELRAVRGLGVGLVYPFSHFRRLEVWLDGVYEQRYRYTCDPLEENPLFCAVTERSTDAWYAVPEIAWVHDSAIFGPTGPLSGRRMRFSIGGAIGQRESYGFEGDYRAYLNLRQRYAFALRLVGAADWGRDRMRIVFGGPYSLRGYTDTPLAGTRIAFANLEFRFPFIERLYIAWPLPLLIGGLRGALFFDAGAAWDDAGEFRAFRSAGDGQRFRLEDVKASAGFGVAVNLGSIVLRWDLTRRTDLSQWLGKAKGELSIGWEF